MIDIRLGADDLTRVRFARSPLEELIHSIPVLAGTRGSALHRPWVSMTRPRVAGLDLGVLLALTRGPRILPDFLAPEPDRLTGTLADELDAIEATAPEEVVRSLEEMRPDWPDGLLPAELRPLYERPARELGRLTTAMRAYWAAAIEPVWPRLRALHDADLEHRAQQLTTGGLAAVFANLHPGAEFENGLLRIDKPQLTAVRDASGTGLVLVPCSFAWPKLLVLYNEPYQPTLTYSPRGIGTLWENTPQSEREPLGELLGRNRAALLAHLDLPTSTTQLAAYLGVSPAAVSQHMAVLRRARLVTSRRTGRWVLHQRTPLASELLAASGPDGA
ncbi:DUF5937 family protein [Streptomyces sp. NPDC048604]|uniref:ArsR/SmtB family transcription factor n=1 Tax=Streptomyces sp. NPDC048604 TaxID=3365578 RepID=UPI0037198FFF